MIRGVIQADVLIRAALVQGLRELRVEPWLLDYVFVGLEDDDLTRRQYGAKEAANAKEWFLNTKIECLMAHQLVQASSAVPGVTIQLVESSEQENTLADVHPEPNEADDTAWPALAGPFAPTSYDAATGKLVLPDSVTLVVVPGMKVVDVTGRVFEIVSVEESAVYLPEGSLADVSSVTIKGHRPARYRQLEIAAFREAFQLVCRAQEAVHLQYLHSLIVFVLLRGRKDLLEARGFERSYLSSGPVMRDEEWGETEVVYERTINVAGIVRHTWPRSLTGVVESVQTTEFVGAAGDEGETFVGGGGIPDEQQPWLAQDMLLVGK